MDTVGRHSVSVAAVVTDRQNRVLVIKRHDNGAWQLPGGVLELSETIEAGVIREVREETGVTIRPVRLTGVYKNMSLCVVALVMRGEWVAGEPQPTPESAEVDWWTAEQVTSRMTEAFAVRILDAIHESGPVIRHHDGTNLLT